MTIFETDQDLLRESKAINTFVSVFKGSFKKLGPHDIDYKIFDKDAKLIAYAEVKGRLKTMKTAYPLPVALSKLNKLIEKRLNPVLIWASMMVLSTAKYLVLSERSGSVADLPVKEQLTMLR